MIRIAEKVDLRGQSGQNPYTSSDWKKSGAKNPGFCENFIKNVLDKAFLTVQDNFCRIIGVLWS